MCLSPSYTSDTWVVVVFLSFSIHPASGIFIHAFGQRKNKNKYERWEGIGTPTHIEHIRVIWQMEFFFFSFLQLCYEKHSFQMIWKKVIIHYYNFHSSLWSFFKVNHLHGLFGLICWIHFADLREKEAESSKTELNIFFCAFILERICCVTCMYLYAIENMCRILNCCLFRLVFSMTLNIMIIVIIKYRGKPRLCDIVYIISCM